jgi:hypothetical protein
MLPPSWGISVFALCSECRPINRGGINDIREVGKYTNETLRSPGPTWHTSRLPLPKAPFGRKFDAYLAC